MILFDILAGLLLLLAGKKLFWISVGIMGFLAGMELAAQYAAPNSPGIMVLYAILFGIFGALLAIAFQWIVILWLGFLGGGYVLMNIFPGTSNQVSTSWALYIVGGLIGVIIMLISFDWALIGITSLLGTILIVQHLSVPESTRNPIFIGCFIGGIVVQYLTAMPE